ncbi:Uridine nucleosidase 1 [Thecaphora frezii]
MRRDSSASSCGKPSVLRRLSTLVNPSSSGHSRSASQSHVHAFSPPSPRAKAVWLDCDPGHDDAIALLLALHHPNLQLLGVSTVAGNASGKDTFLNAVRLMAAYRASPDIPVIRGSDSPLVKQVKTDVGIHGSDGLGGVQGLPSLHSPLCQPWLFPSYPKTSSPTTAPEPSLFLYTLSTIITERLSSGKPPMHIAVTGPMTNVALFLKCYPHLIKGIAQIVLMGGAAGVRGNRGALAEFNILNDPEAASIVFNTDIKVVMAGLNVTHQAIFTTELHDRLLRTRVSSPAASRRQSRLYNNSGQTSSSNSSPTASPVGAPLSLSTSPSNSPSDLKRMLSSTLTFFAKTYASEFGFTRGPPVHDMLAIAYIIDPTLFHRRVASPGDAPDPSLFAADPHVNKEPRREVDPSAHSGQPQHTNALGLDASGPSSSQAREETAAATSGIDHSNGKGHESTSSRVLGRKASVRSSSGHPAASAMAVSPGQPPKRYRVDVECNEGLACGATVVDFWGDRVEHDGWGRGGRNVEVLENLDCPRMWDIFFDVVERAEAHIGACIVREGMEGLSTSASSDKNEKLAAALALANDHGHGHSKGDGTTQQAFFAPRAAQLYEAEAALAA